MQQRTHLQTWVEVDLQAIRHNIYQLRDILPNKSKVMAVVKADGYGHGMIEVAKTALDAGAELLAVARLEEALQLRKEGINAPILILGIISPEDAPLAADHNITVTVFQKEWLEQMKNFTFHRPLNAHLKIDTGMGRIGISKIAMIQEIVQKIISLDQMKLTGVYTHFATADEEDLSYYFQQMNQFKNLVKLLEEKVPHSIQLHVGNSAAALRFPEDMFDYVRYGISMYGLQPSKAVAQEEILQLKRAFSFHSRLIHVKKVSKGDSIGYGRSYQAEKEEWIGTIPVGYGDGWTRRFQGFSVLVGGKKQKIIGKICMDQMMITLDQPYPIGEKVTFIGKQKDEQIKMEDLAQHLDTTHYEIPCMINQRIPRIYKS